MYSMVHVLPILGIATFLDVATSVIRYSTSSRRPYLDDKIVKKRLLWIHQVEGLGPCIGECARDEMCVSVFYNRKSKQCQGHSITHGLEDGAEQDPFTRYYVQPYGSNYIGDKCSSASDCTSVTENTECRSQVCECLPGYYFSPRTHECLADCVTFGPGFVEIPDFFISYYNIENVENVTVDECLELCRNTSAYTCRTLEYGWVSLKCSLQNVTSLHVPSEWYEDEDRVFNISHFQRDCA